MSAVLTTVLAAFSFLDPRPPISDVERLPSVEELNKMHGESWRYWKKLHVMEQACFDWPGLQAAKAESHLISEWVIHALCARGGMAIVVCGADGSVVDMTPRDCLAKLQGLMGLEAYAAGHWPVLGYPHWRGPLP
jgi:hypothetical protein